MNKIKTKLGTFYYDKEDHLDGNIATLLDSDKKWFLDIWDTYTIKDLKEINSIGDFPYYGFCENIMWASSKEEVLDDFIAYKNEELTKVGERRLNKKERKHLLEDAESWVYRIGETYFIPNYTEI